MSARGGGSDGPLATGSWVTPRIVTVMSILMIAVTVVTLGYLFASATSSIDRHRLGADFSSFWTAGQLVIAGQPATAYDSDILFKLQRGIFGDTSFAAWNYPPSFLIVAAVLSMMPYLAGLLVWQGMSAAAALAVVQRIIPGRLALLAALGFPAVLICLGHGQTGFLTAALLGGGLLALGRSQILAGVLFGLMSYKPQLGVLIPFVLVAGGYWRAFVSAAVTVLALVALTVGLWGWAVWLAFFEALPQAGREVLQDGNGAFWRFQSAFSWMRLVGFSVPAAYGLQAVVSVGALIGCVWAWRTDADLRLKSAALVTGALLCSPYVYDYDLVAFGMALAFFAAHGMAHGFRRWEQSAIAFGWFAPLFTREISQLTFVPLGLVALLTVFALVLLRIHASGEAGRAAAATA